MERAIGTPAQGRDGRAAAFSSEHPEEPDAAAGPAGDDGAAAGARRGTARYVLVLASVAAFAYALDLVTKLLVVAKLEYHAPVDLIGSWLQLRATRNAGAAFGMGQAYTVVFTVIAAGVIVVIARLARSLRSVPWAIALGLLLGGALGNLTDRVFRAPGVFSGHVVDFIAPRHFAVFNLADSAIVVGGCLIVLLSFLGLHPDGTSEKDADEAAAEEA